MSSPANGVANLIKTIDTHSPRHVKKIIFDVMDAYSWALTVTKNGERKQPGSEQNNAIGAIIVTIGALSASFFCFSYATSWLASRSITTSLLRGVEWAHSGALYWVVSNGIQSIQEARESQQQTETQTLSPSAPPNKFAHLIQKVGTLTPGFIKNPILVAEHALSLALKDESPNQNGARNASAVGAIILATGALAMSFFVFSRAVNRFTPKSISISFLKGIEWAHMSAATCVVCRGLQSMQKVDSKPACSPA